jgi:hypothetical protein
MILKGFSLVITIYIDNNYFGTPTSMVIDDQSNIFIAGTVNSPNYGNFLMVKYNTNGLKIWEKSYNGAANQSDKANDIALDRYGMVISTGSIVNSFSNWNDYFTVKLDQNGNQIWTITYNSSISSGDISYSVATTNSNKIVVTGESPILPNYTTSITTIQYSEFIGINPVSSEIPISFNLHQNFPNPFNPATIIKYDLPQDVNVTIKIYDLLGMEIETLVNNELGKAGRYEINWDAAKYASGVYIYRIEAGDPSSSSGGAFVQSRKMVLIK